MLLFLFPLFTIVNSLCFSCFSFINNIFFLLIQKKSFSFQLRSYYEHFNSHTSYSSSYISSINLIYLIGTPFFSKIHHITSLRIPWRSLQASLYFSIRRRIKKIASVVDHPHITPNWFSNIVIAPCLYPCSREQQNVKTNKTICPPKLTKT